MEKNIYRKIAISIGLFVIFTIGVWIFVSKTGSKPGFAATENEGLILIVHQVNGKVSLVRGEDQETFSISNDQIHFPDPVLSPDGTRIAFRDLEGFLNIYDVPMQETTTYTDAPMGGLHPFGWSPDGEKIAYGCPELPASICIFTLNSGDIKTFANMQDGPPNSLGGYTFAGWSNDGNKIGILYLGEPTTHFKNDANYFVGTLKILDLETETLTDVFSEMNQHGLSRMQNAVLSPDGSSFLFSAMSGGFYVIYQVQADGSALTRITGEQYSYHILHPVWQPDGQSFITVAPEQGEEPDQAMLVPTIFDLSGNIVSQIKVELGGIPTSWIGGVHLFSRE